MAFVLACLTASVLAPVPQLSVAAVYNLSGDGKVVGQQGFNGLKLAAEELNRTGRIKVVLHQVDAKNNATTAANTLRRFLRTTRVDAIVGLQDFETVLAVGTVAQQARIPYLACGATVVDFTRRVGTYCFSVSYGDDEQARAMARFAREVLNLRTTAVLVDPGHESTRLLAKEFPKAFTELGGRWLLTVQDTEPGRSEPLKFGTESVFVAATSKDAGKTVKRLRQHGFEGHILASQFFDTPMLAQDAGIASYKVFFTTHVAYDNPDPQVRTFVKSYSARFKETPNADLAALSADAMRLLADARFRQGNGSLRDSIGATRGFQGITGEITYSAGNREPVKPVSVVELLGKDRVYRATVENL